MALFGLIKKKEGKKACTCPESAGKRPVNEDGCRVKILGAGCKSCHAMYENALETAGKYGLSDEVAYITDMPKITGYGVMKLPALVIDEKVDSQGRVLKAGEIENLMRKAGVIDG